LRRLNFRLPVAPCNINRLLMIFLLGGHAALKRKKCGLPHENSPGGSMPPTARAAYPKAHGAAWSVRNPVEHFCCTRHIVLSAKRRGIHVQAWGSAPGLWECKRPALKARFTLPELSRAFSPESFRGCSRLKLT
jgi:hypothetical protein